MVKIGEVEFLVKFDTIGNQFQKALTEGLGSLDFGLDDIEDKLDNIEGHLGLLVTPFSGNRLVDIIKAKGHLQQLQDPEEARGYPQGIIYFLFLDFFSIFAIRSRVFRATSRFSLVSWAGQTSPIRTSSWDRHPSYIMHQFERFGVAYEEMPPESER